jgi:short subunit dehydrogenase-like uncharacterized protein
MDASSYRRLDLVVFGATSFVGQILCKRLVERHGISGPLRWAIAGRSASKLDRVAEETGADMERIVADVSDPEALAAMARSTRVVASTVGPYALYGSPLVAAVAAIGTDYCDLTGETQWMRKMIDAHSDEAKASGARIVHTCGFDCIPADLGLWYLQQRAQEQFGIPCHHVSMRVATMKGGASGGTIASMMNLMEEAATDPAVRKLLSDPYALAPPDQRTGPRQPDINLPQHDDASGQWVAPFVMAAVDTRVVHRSHALLGRPWGADFTYDEAMLMGTGPVGATKAALGPARKMLGRVLPKPGDGPSAEAQEKGSFDLRFFGSTADGRTIRTRVTGDRDPGYGSTAKMLAESAVALVDLDRSDVPGGFWTPSTAFGDSLIERLEAHAGVRFDVMA